MPRPTGETESPVARPREDQSTEKADAETPAPASVEPQASGNSSEKDEKQSTSETVSEPTTEKKGN